MTDRTRGNIAWALVAALGVVNGGALDGCSFDWPIDVVVSPDTKATRATYVYEKDETAVPAGVLSALNKLNRLGVVATPFEADTIDGGGEVPDQYRVALAAAKEAGLPALVVQAGDQVLRTVKAPTTEEAVMEAGQ